MSLYDIIRKPIITEASMAAMDQKKYTFEVDSRAHKLLIKQAVEAVFDVKVASVNTISVNQNLNELVNILVLNQATKKLSLL